MAALLVAYTLYIGKLWRAAFILPSAVFLLSTRSLSEYLIMVVAMWVMSIAAAGRGPERDGNGTVNRQRTALAHRRRAAALALPIMATLIFVSLALATPAPLSITIRGVETNGQFRSIWKIQALVTNQSGKPLQPHFATDASGYMTTFWNVVSGPDQLKPGQRALYTLVAPNVGSMPGVTQPFLLQAVTASPQTISSSGLFTPEHFDAYISPSYVDRVLPLGQIVVLTVQLRSPYGAPVHKRGVKVAMGQVIYAQSTLIPAEARINNAAQGQSPVVARTNANGIATFRIRDANSQGGNPIYFQAYVDPAAGFPYGYSEVVSVQWGDLPAAHRNS